MHLHKHCITDTELSYAYTGRSQLEIRPSAENKILEPFQRE